MVTLCLITYTEGNGNSTQPRAMPPEMSGDKVSFLQEVASVAATSNKAIDPWMKEMLDRINEERKKAGVSLQLCLNEKLIKTAKKHNDDMAKNDFTSHTGSDGSSIADRITRQNYKFGFYGENVAKGQESVTNVMNAFMNSPVHKDNILYDRFKHVGIAWHTGKNQWTQVFAAAREGVEFCMDYDVGTNKPTKKPTKKPTNKPTKPQLYQTFTKVGRCKHNAKTLTKKAKNVGECYKKCKNENYNYSEFIKKGKKKECYCAKKCSCMEDVNNKNRITIMPTNLKKLPKQCSKRSK